MSTRALFVYQIPRTASTSLSQHVGSCLPADAVYNRKVIEEIHNGVAVTAECDAPSVVKLRAELSASRDYKVYLVMAPFGVHQAIGRAVELVTVLRNPVDRCVSLYRLMRRRPDANSISRKVDAYDDDYEALLADRSILCFHNEQTRMLSNTQTLAPPNGDDLERAIENLQSFSYVGDFNMLEDLKEFVAARTGTAIASFPCVNGADIPVANEEDFREQIAAANTWDAKLYDWSLRHVARGRVPESLGHSTSTVIHASEKIS